VVEAARLERRPLLRQQCIRTPASDAANAVSSPKAAAIIGWTMPDTLTR
jgi:hypothetical protein